MAFTAFAALVVLGVLFFVDDEDGRKAHSSAGIDAVPVQPVAEARPFSQMESAHDRFASEFTPDEELIDDAQGLSTDGFDTHGIDTDGFEPEGFDTGGIEPDPETTPEPAIDTPDEGVIVESDGSGS